MNPASAVKIITTLAALESLGPAFTWKTELYPLGSIADGILQGDLLLKGGGDPFLVEEQLRSMLKALKEQALSTLLETWCLMAVILILQSNRKRTWIIREVALTTPTPMRLYPTSNP